MRKSFLLSFFVISVFLPGCLKEATSSGCPYLDDAVAVPAAELANLDGFIALNSGTYGGAVKDNRGFYHIIEVQGTGPKATTLCNTVSVLYTGKLTDGTVFDQTVGTPIVFTLGQLIPGWKKGIPLINAGGKIKLILPPSLAYGAAEIKDPQTGAVKIPANSILIFEIELKEVL